MDLRRLSPRSPELHQTVTKGLSGKRSSLIREAVQKPVEGLAFSVPTWRPDIVREIDLVEEIGRVLGYEHIPERLPAGVSTQGGDSERGRFAESVRDILVGAGLQEIVSHSLLAPSPLEDLGGDQGRVTIRSALSAELSGLRRTLLPGLLDAVERNARRGNAPLAFFEIGQVFDVFDQNEGEYRETTMIGGALTGTIAPPEWQKSARAPAADFYMGRGLVERIAESLHIPDLDFRRSADPRLHPGRAADIRIADACIGCVGELHPRLAVGLTVRDPVIVFSLEFDPLRVAIRAGSGFVPPSPYPAVVRDLAPRVDAEVPYGEVRAAIEKTGEGILEQYRLTDVYTGAPLPEGTKSLTLSFTFRAPDRTLTETEVNDALARLRAALEAGCGASFVG